MKARGVLLTFVCMMICTAVLFIPAAVCAAELDLGTAYTAAELQKVRDWEKTWVGKKIDNTNIDQVAEFLPESWIELYKDPKKWGAPDGTVYSFEIVPYKKINETKGFTEASKTCKPQLDGNGYLANIKDIAGRPFPDPKNGLEVAWNFELNNKGDTYQYRRYSPNINPKSRTERVSDQEQWLLYFINRTEIDPKPAFPEKKNKKGYRRGMFLHMYKPAEFINTRMYTLRYIDQSKEDDSYLYYSQFRRIRRMSTAQRTDSIDGTDLIYDDEDMWDGQLLRNNYTLKGRKDMLACRHQDMKKLTREQGQGQPNGIVMERCNTYIVEVVNKDPNYLYSKRIWYVDPENYYVLWQEIYDAPGRFWKCFMQMLDVEPTAIGDERAEIVGTIYHDFQRIHSGLSHNEHFYTPKVSHKISPSMFTIANLQKTY